MSAAYGCSAAHPPSHTTPPARIRSTPGARDVQPVAELPGWMSRVLQTPTFFCEKRAANPSKFMETKYHLHHTHDTRATIHLALEVGSQCQPLQRARFTTDGDDGAGTYYILQVLHIRNRDVPLSSSSPENANSRTLGGTLDGDREPYALVPRTTNKFHPTVGPLGSMFISFGGFWTPGCYSSPLAPRLVADKAWHKSQRITRR
ncbi:hypothetical protein BDN71DRAFT_1453778 [Pleurotus eryngii]|uniref:Uncharacterized protein n=1 Tax=Pleurotus eryngii TaxID=5323 RepID=A0A9P6DCZ8_PLEER|nr:hypothetical protein BDN71DRAFT_1453778 [Pleurotus eryngii]